MAPGTLASIVVQPPPQVQANRQLHPIVARLAPNTMVYEGAIGLRAHAYLIPGGDWRLCQPLGNAVDPVWMHESEARSSRHGGGGGSGSGSGSQHKSAYFKFPNLHIRETGTFVVGVIVEQTCSMYGWTTIDSAESACTVVSGRDVARERPSRREERLLQCLDRAEARVGHRRH